MVLIKNKSLGLLLLFALIIEFIFPKIKLGFLSWVGTLLILIVAILLFFKKR